jgi:hypothetical protein
LPLLVPNNVMYALLCAILPLVFTAVLCEALIEALNIRVKVAMFPVFAVLLTGITLTIATGIWVFSPMKFQSGMCILLASFMFL